jgi:hypothetical protein
VALTQPAQLTDQMRGGAAAEVTDESNRKTHRVHDDSITQYTQMASVWLQTLAK